MNSIDSKNLIKELIIANNITSESDLLGTYDLTQEQISKVIDWLIEDNFIVLGKPNVAGRTFTINKD